MEIMCLQIVHNLLYSNQGILCGHIVWSQEEYILQMEVFIK